MKRNAGKADDTPSAKRRDLDSFIKEEEAKVTTAKARGLRTEQDLPNHLNVTPTERPTLALTDEDISTLIEFMPKVRKGFRFAFDKEVHLRVKLHSLLAQTVTQKGITTDGYHAETEPDVELAPIVRQSSIPIPRRHGRSAMVQIYVLRQG